MDDSKAEKRTENLCDPAGAELPGLTDDGFIELIVGRQGAWLESSRGKTSSRPEWSSWENGSSASDSSVSQARGTAAAGREKRPTAVIGPRIRFYCQTFFSIFYLFPCRTFPRFTSRRCVQEPLSGISPSVTAFPGTAPPAGEATMMVCTLLACQPIWLTLAGP